MGRPVYDNKGYAILLGVLIIGAVGLSVAFSVVLLSTDAHRTSFNLIQSNQAKALTNACAEKALDVIRDNDAYAGTGGLTLGQGSCLYTVTGTSPNKTIQATGIVDTTTRKVKITTDQINPQINISSWQEVSDF